MAPLRSSVLQGAIHLCILARTTLALPLQDITLPLPIGTSNHGTPGLLCTPTRWSDVIFFYLFNYVAHAATVLTRPGERSDDFTASVIGSLMFPALGLYRGIEAIFCGAVFVRNDDLKKAARSGALCMVVRGKDWFPVDGDEVRDAIFREGQDVQEETGLQKSTTREIEASDLRHVLISTYSPPWIKSKFGSPVYVNRQVIHGTYELPKGYRFAVVPSDTQFLAPISPSLVLEVSATHNFMKALVALVQSCYAIATLYRSRGDQIEQFGYAAFGLTVAPYAVMSCINLIGNICRPDYASLYMVENGIMREARRRGGVFEGSVGTVSEEISTCHLECAGQVHNAEDLHFSADVHGNCIANFAISLTPRYHIANPICHRIPEKCPSVCSTSTLQFRSVQALPPKLDYTGKANEDVVLIPCCNALKRGWPSSTSDCLPYLYCLRDIRLQKPFPLIKRRDWIPSFAPIPLCHPIRWKVAKYAITTVISLIPLAIYGVMSRFQVGAIPISESSTWKAYTMQWLLLGAFSGIWWVFDQEGKEAMLTKEGQYGPVLRGILYVISASPAIGGFVVVGQMLSRYGVCTWVGS